MKQKYKDKDLENFLKRVWQRSNELETQGLKSRSLKMRQLYKRLMFNYQEKKRINSGNYIFN